MALTNILEQRYLDLLSGKTKPWELPEFGGLEKQLSTAAGRTRESSLRTSRRMGLAGPAAARIAGTEAEAAMSPVGQYISSMYRGIPGEAADIGKWLDSLRQAHYQAHRQRKHERQLARAEGIGSGFSSVMGAGCVLATACYGESSEEVDFLRFYRDNILSDTVVRGYYIFSDIILPLMKFKLAKKIVKTLIVNPLIRTGLRWMNWGGFYLLAPFDTLITKCFLGFWAMIGNRNPYRRTNGEIF